MGSWTLDDIAWGRFDRSKVDPELLRLVKAASLVEHNGADYAQYLGRVFHDDAAFQEVAQRWGEEEIQHGRALARWAALNSISYVPAINATAWLTVPLFWMNSTWAPCGAAGLPAVKPLSLLATRRTKSASK